MAPSESDRLDELERQFGQLYDLLAVETPLFPQRYEGVPAGGLLLQGVRFMTPLSVTATSVNPLVLVAEALSGNRLRLHFELGGASRSRPFDFTVLALSERAGAPADPA